MILTDTQIRQRSTILTTIVVTLMLILLFILKLYTTIPPFGGGGGGGGALGYVELASGNEPPSSPDIAPQTIQPETAVNQTVPDEEILTQDDEESASIDEPEKPKEKVKPVITPPVKKPIVTTKPVVAQPKVEAKALYPGKQKDGGSKGSASTGTGVQGTADGNPFGGYGQGSGDGDGNGGGKGDGIGGGNGDGIGPGSGGGTGINVNLKGRKILKRPNVTDNSQETGTVVVEITVDKNGKVVSAVPGGQGSTTTSKRLYDLSKLKALECQFDVTNNPDNILQKGTITFVYKYKK
ncbi:MAG: hypothetical protein IPO27_03055 [Bacteroidetes bacterium]|nr:hypothetical protein [Bacteroidota bacterium]